MNQKKRHLIVTLFETPFYVRNITPRKRLWFRISENLKETRVMVDIEQ